MFLIILIYLNIYSSNSNNWIISPSFIPFSFNVLNLKIVLPPTANRLFVSLYLSYILYKRSSISAKVSVFKHLILQSLIFWSVDIKFTTIISLKLTNFSSFCNFKLLISFSLIDNFCFKLLFSFLNEFNSL